MSALDRGEPASFVMAGEGLPSWKVGEFVTIKGTKWVVTELYPASKEMVLVYHSKVPGTIGVMERLGSRGEAV